MRLCQYEVDAESGKCQSKTRISATLNESCRFDMKIRIFEETDEIVLSNEWVNIDDKSLEDRISVLSRKFDTIVKNNPSDYTEIDIESCDIDYYSSLYCDIWLEGVGLHTQLYVGQYDVPGIDNITVDGELCQFNLSTHKGYSGNVSGVIAESLLASVLVNIFECDECDFAHFGTEKDLFPDFGVICRSEKLLDKA